MFGVRGSRVPRTAHRAPFCLLAAALTLLTPAALSAQSAPQRTAINLLRDSLASQSDTVALARDETAMIARAKADRENALLHLELGFVGQRLGELTNNKQHYDDAASEFEWAGDLQPDWPYAWYGLGLAELAIGEHENIAVESLKEMLGKDYLSKAANAFGRAARADPAFAQAVIDLARTAMRQKVHARLEVARNALREAAATAAAGSTELQLSRGRIEREAGEGDSALVAFRRYLHIGGDSGVGMLEIARTYFYSGHTLEGGAAYHAGLRSPLSRDARAMHRSDLSWIATPAELTSFDSLPPGGHEAWITAFWSRRDLEEGRRRGERLGEHYRRYFYALRNYRLVSSHRRYDITERFRSDQQDVDDRGVIYLRHGEPNQRATFTERSIEPNESWLYVEPGGNRIFHFVARDDVQDFKLVESLADAFGLRVALALTNGASTGAAASLFESRSGLDPMYQRLASLSPSARTSMLSEERSRGRNAIKLGTTTDSYALRFRRVVKPVIREMAVSGANGESRLLVPFALPGSQLVPFTRRASIVYPVELRVVAQRSDGFLRSLDTLRTFSAGRRLGAHENLTGLLQLSVPPGAYRIRFIVAQPGGEAGGIAEEENFEVPALRATQPGLSDIVLGKRGDGPFWLDHGDSIPVSALPTYPEGSSLALYYEVHGLAAGARYRTHIEVNRESRSGMFGLFRGRRTPVSLEYDGVSEGELTRVVQTVNVGQLPPGRYRLIVRPDLGSSDPRHVRVVIFVITARSSSG